MERRTPPRGVRAGTLLAGRYTIVEPLGAGAMGTVFRAVHIELEREVAIKLIGNGRGATSEQVARFEREAKLLARLSHPAIVTVHDFGLADDGTWFLVLELVRGESMQQRIERTGAQPWREVLELAVLMSDALASAHAAGVLHRDLKPANVMLSTATATPVKLIDFGLARLVDVAGPQPATESQYVLGTPGYIAPEYAWTGTMTPRADAYALGVVLFELLTGAHPFADVSGAGDRAEAAQASLTARAPDVPAALAALVLSLLSRDPEQRPVDPRAAFAALRSALSATPARGAPASIDARGSTAAPSPPQSTQRTARPMVEVKGGLVALALGTQRVDVRVPRFFIDKHPVTNADWLAFVTATGRAPPSSWAGARPTKLALSTPITSVSFEDASAYAAWAGCRLPTEAEWELAARGASSRKFPWGDEWQSGLCHPVHEVRFDKRAPGPIGVFSPQGDSEAGVSDLGQLWEWVVAPYQPAGHVVRGGPWRDRLQPAELSNRSWEDAPARDVGFRCACNA